MLAALSYRLEPPDLEAQFRLEGLKRDTGVATGLMLVDILFQVLSFPTDLKLLERSGALNVVWTIRGVSTAIAIAAILLLRRSRTVAFIDHVVFVWAALLLVGILAANAMMPADYTTHVAWDLLLALAVYAVVPLPLSRQLIIASIITVGDIVLFWQQKVLVWPVARVDILAAFACANIVGIFASWELQRWRRREFQALRREADARIDLEKAWLEIKTLRGIIPICSLCKKVRTDEGDMNAPAPWCSSMVPMGGSLKCLVTR